MVAESNREISFVIEKRLGVLSTSENGWRKELNLVSWNGKPAKLDIREWSPDHTRMAKGITLRSEEARLLQRALYRWFTGYGKPNSVSSPAEETAAVPEEMMEMTAEQDTPFEEPELQPLIHPETGEYLEADYIHEADCVQEPASVDEEIETE